MTGIACLGYPTGRREELSAAALGLSPETADAIRKIELLAEDAERFFRVLFVQLRSVTAKARNELARNLGCRNADHLLILTKDFDVLEFVLIDKETRQRHAPGGGPSVRVIPRVVTVMRKANTHLDRRILRRTTWTGKDGLDQFDKLRSVFEAAHYSGQYFQNRALFADHYLETRLREDAAWRDDPSTTFASVRDLLINARGRWSGKPEQTVRAELFEPLWKLLGFKAKVAKAANKDHLTPDYELHGADGQPLTVAFCYRWDRWLDGPDLNDPDTPEENPGAAVVSALAEGKARWVIVTNGKFWRLYSRDAHSRSTNFYEVDLEEALLASGETDPNEAFRYWWLFFRRQAFATLPESDPPTCWLDTIVRGSRDYAKRLGDRLKDRIFVEIFPHLAQGFLLDRKKRLGLSRAPSDDELRDTFEATLTLLYRLLFLLYAESRDLLPVREAAYKAASLKQVKEEIAEHAGVAESEAGSKLKAYSDAEATIYDRLTRLFAVMDQGDAVLNVPCYNGGLFLTQPDRQSADREHRIARFLLEHKVPDRHLAVAIDRLARDVDEKTFSLAFIDYKSLEVRHLGSIYEGLLEFKLKIAEEDLGVTTEKKAEKYIPLAQVRPGRGKRAAAGAVVRKGEVYLSNDKAERKATGSYYTPDPIVEYIVEHTVGPVLAEKLDALRPDLNAAGKTYHRHLTNAKNNPGLLSGGGTGVPPVDIRAFAAAKTYAEHRDLVDRVFDLKVLDPAMGSGHFLVESVDFITDRLLDFLNRFPHNPVQFALDKTRRSILDALGEQGVTVDPDKLTDVNLLKRHVLKRCIYGVDLNPMAVELAKVSLWLDAFTLGAPLSFLDHHLRCGNSLIGATFEDLKKATTGQLFAIDYEPLLRAIRHVLFVNEMADATAAEVHKSADEYSHARRELSGYQIVLDLLVADHFVGGAGVPPAKQLKPSKLLQEASDLDLTTRAKLLASLDEKAALLVEQVENVARRSDLRFFHWEIEFPEVFFGFADADRRQIKHRNDSAKGSAGFDAAIGNPPWGHAVHLEAFRRMALFEPVNDDHCECFLCLAVQVLATKGRLGEVLPDTILSPAKAAIRRHLLRRSQTTSCLNLGPDWFTSDVRMSTVIWLARGIVEASGEYEILTCILPVELRRGCQAATMLLPDAIRMAARKATARDCLDSTECSIPLFGDSGAVTAVGRAFQRALTLADLCDHARGVELNKQGEIFRCPLCKSWDAPPRRDSDGEYEPKMCSTCSREYRIDRKTQPRVIVSENQQRGANWQPYIDGDSIRRYEAAHYRFIDLSAEGINYKSPECYRSPKILIRQAGIGVSAILDTRGAYCPQSVYMYHVKESFRRSGIGEDVVLSLICSRLFHLQVFMCFGEIDSSRAFAKLTHARLSGLRILDPTRLSSVGALLQRIKKAIVLLGNVGVAEGREHDWDIEACWSGILGLSKADVEAVVRNFSHIHENEVLLSLFPEGVAGHEADWVRTWVDAAARCGVNL